MLVHLFKPNTNDATKTNKKNIQINNAKPFVPVVNLSINNTISFFRKAMI